MKSAALRALCDLFAAAEAVGDDQPILGGMANGGEEFEFADGHGDSVFVAFEAEGAGHAAAPRGRGLEVDADAVQDGFFRSHLH